nr:hypothetical protein [Tanacetum cinerariifolium]
MDMLSVRVHKFEQKARRKIDFDKKESARLKKKKFGMIAGYDTEDAIEEGVAKIYNLITGADTEEASTACDTQEFALMGVTSEETELGWDDSTFSVFITNSEDVEGRPLFHSDKSLEVNTNNFSFSDSSVKSSDPKPNDSTSCASTSSVSTSENEAEIESNVGTLILEPIIVQDLPSFSCNSSDKNENTSRTSCNKNVPTGKRKVFAPVPAGRQNRPFLVPIDRRYSPSDFKLLDEEKPVELQTIMATSSTKAEYVTAANCCCQFKYADAAFSKNIPLTMYVVPTGRVVVPTGKYVVPAGNVL